MADVTQTISGDSASAQKAYADLAKQVVKLEEANVRLARRVDESANATNRATSKTSFGVNNAVREIGSLAMSWVSVSAAISAAVEAQEEYNRTIGDASSTHVSVADSQAQIIKNMAPASMEEKARFIREVEKIQQESRFPSLQALNIAAAEGLSASAGDMKGVEDALRTSAPMAKDKPDELRFLVGAAIDLQRASQVKSAKENLGFLLQLGTEARVVSLQKTAENASPAVASAAATVTSDPRQATIDAGALFAALSSEGVDPTGETTRQAVTVIAGELRSFFKEGVKVNIPGLPQSVLMKPKEDPNSIEGRIKFLQDNPRYAKAFLDNANLGRERYRVPVEQLLNGGQTDEQFRRARQNLTFDGRTVDQMTGELKTLTPQLKLSEQQRSAQSITQQLENAQTSQALRAEAQRIRNEALGKTRNYTFGKWGLGYAVQRGLFQGSADIPGMYDDSGYIENTKLLLERQQAAIRYKKRSLLLGGKVFGDERREREQLSDQERNDFDYLGKQIEILNKLMAEQNRMMEAEKQKQPQVAPAMQRQREAHQER